VFAKDCALVTESWLLAMSLQPLEKLLSLLLHCQSCCHVLKWLSHVEIDRYGFFSGRYRYWYIGHLWTNNQCR